MIHLLAAHSTRRRVLFGSSNTPKKFLTTTSSSILRKNPNTRRLLSTINTNTSSSPIWTPTPESISNSNLTKFAKDLSATHNLPPFQNQDVTDYQRLHSYSVSHPNEFWNQVWDHVNFIGDRNHNDTDGIIVDPPNAAWNRSGNPSPLWFPNSQCNHAENLLMHGNDDDIAILSTNEYNQQHSHHPLLRMTYAELKSEVATLAKSMVVNDNIKPNDVVAGLVCNSPSTLIAMLATTSLGAVWACCSPDFGVRGIVDRLGQIQPKLLFMHDLYYYRGNRFEIREKVEGEVWDCLKDCTERVIVLNYHEDSEETAAIMPNILNAVTYSDYTSSHKHETKLNFYRSNGFQQPVYIMFSSGTTGAPKCMIQGIGVTLNHMKESTLHMNINRNDNLFWFTTTGWMMWNWLLGASLGRGATALLYDGDPMHPSRMTLWDIASEAHLSLFGTSARWLSACMDQDPTSQQSSSPLEHGIALDQLRIVGSTGSPAGGNIYSWVNQHVIGQGNNPVQFVSTSGGTDLNGSFATGNPWLSVHEEELQCVALGLDVKVMNEDGSVDIGESGEQGELTCGIGFPSAPLLFLGDDDDSGHAKYRNAYFENGFGDGVIWQHGDFCSSNPNTGGMKIHGRSDATLNPGGVRIGTAELYRALDEYTSSSTSTSSQTILILDSLVVGQSITLPDGTPDVRIILFLKTIHGDTQHELPIDVVQGIKSHIRKACSPRHVPSVVCAVGDIPYTTNGKKVEIAVSRLLCGKKDVKNNSALKNPESLDFFGSEECLRVLDRLG